MGDEPPNSEEIYEYVLERSNTEWGRSLSYSTAIITIYIEVLVLVLLRERFHPNWQIILSLGLLNIGLVFIFNVKSNIFGIISLGYILKGYHFENKFGIPDGFCHFYIERNNAFMERHVDVSKRWTIRSLSSWRMFGSPMFSARMSSLVLTSGLASFQIGAIVLVMIGISGEFNPSMWTDGLLALVLILGSMAVYFMFVWIITGMYWKATEEWYFDILHEIYPEFYSTKHISYHGDMSDEQRAQWNRALLVSTNRMKR